MLERVHALESHSDYAPDLSDGTQPDWAYSLRSECSDVSRPEDKSLSDLTLVIAEFEEMFVGSNMFSEVGASFNFLVQLFLTINAENSISRRAHALALSNLSRPTRSRSGT